MGLSPCNVSIDGRGRELVEHGTVMFPVACYYDDLAGDAVPWHWHDELEAAIVTEGRAVVAVGTEKYILRQGDGFFINAGVLHSAWDVDHSDCRIHSVVFHPRLVSGSTDSIFWQRYVQPLLANTALEITCFDRSAPWHENAMKAVETAWQSCVAESPGYEFHVRAALSQLVFQISDNCPAIQSRPSEKALRDGMRIKTMVQYVQEHYTEAIDTAQITASALISESECLRCFRSTIGTTPIQYVRQYRIQKAAELLAATDMKITDIGVRCGFQDMSYFAKTFRELRGCSPKEYRDQIKIRG